jgi:hypothetical protein
MIFSFMGHRMGHRTKNLRHSRQMRPLEGAPSRPARRRRQTFQWSEDITASYLKATVIFLDLFKHVMRRLLVGFSRGGMG